MLRWYSPLWDELISRAALPMHDPCTLMLGMLGIESMALSENSAALDSEFHHHLFHQYLRDPIFRPQSVGELSFQDLVHALLWASQNSLVISNCWNLET